MPRHNLPDIIFLEIGHSAEVVQRGGDPPWILQATANRQAFFESPPGLVVIAQPASQSAEAAQRDRDAPPVPNLAPQGQPILVAAAGLVVPSLPGGHIPQPVECLCSTIPVVQALIEGQAFLKEPLRFPVYLFRSEDDGLTWQPNSLPDLAFVSDRTGDKEI